MTKREGEFAPGEICVARVLGKATKGQYTHPRGVRDVLIRMSAPLHGLQNSEGVELDDATWEMLLIGANQIIGLYMTRRHYND